MTQYPLLAALRATREREEAELAAPHIEAARRSAMIAAEERQARIGLERLLQSKLLPHVLKQVGHNLGEGVHREIMKAVSQQKGFSGTTTLRLPTEMLLAADPKSVVGRVVDWWRQDVAPKMSLSAGTDIADRSVQVLDIRLPQMGYREAVWDGL
jgi:hypothetical protein